MNNTTNVILETIRNCLLYNFILHQWEKHLSLIAGEKPFVISKSKGVHPFVSSINNGTFIWIILQYTRWLFSYKGHD